LLEEYVWFDHNSRSYTHPVGQKKPNAWGLYDMLGNVAEMTSDQYETLYYFRSPDTDPKGPIIDSGYSIRGGSFTTLFNFDMQIQTRKSIEHTEKKDNLGFRLVYAPLE
jgi:formylglycine-generating enzyme required for sulfatase activity